MTLSRQQIRAKFGDDYIANDRTFRMGIDQRFTSRIAERFAGRRVLETCTGAGFTTIALARRVSHVVTVEIDPENQAQARRNVAKAGLEDRVTFVTGDVLEYGTLDQSPPFDAAFMDPDWGESGLEHLCHFRNSSTHPPADVLLERTLGLTPDVAIVLPPVTDVGEFAGLPTHERQHLYFGECHELYCLFFGRLSRSSGKTELRL